MHAEFFDDDVFVVRTIKVFPTDITADGWDNVAAISNQNLGEYALYQDFNRINSASLSESRRPREASGSLVGDVGSSSVEMSERVEVDTEVTTASSSESALQDVIETEVVEEAEPQVVEVPTEANKASSSEEVSEGEEVLPEETNSENATEPAAGESAEPVTVSLLSTSRYMLATADLLTEFTTNTSTPAAAPDAIASTSDDSVAEQEQDVNPISPVVSTSSTTTKDTMNANEANTDVAPETDTAVEIDTAEIIPENASSTTTQEDESNFSATTTIATPEREVEEVVAEESQPCDKNCGSYVIELGDFSFPLTENSEITGAQLRLSLAAKQRPTRERIPMLSIKYTYNGGTTWGEAGSVIINDEVSNGINGGYFLFALPEIQNQEMLDSLQIELVYNDDPYMLESLLIESAWLELFTLEAPNSNQPSSFLELLSNDGYDDEMLQGDDLLLPDGTEVEIPYTDENAGETLIIKADKRSYAGISEAVTYFSVTNTSDAEDDFALQTYFPKGVGEVKSLEVFNQNKERDAVIPEYHPYVYHCEAGWEYAGEFAPGTLQDLSKQLSVELPTMPSAPGDASSTSSSTSDAVSEIPTEAVATSSSFDEVVDAEATDLSTSSVLDILPEPTPAPLFQMSLLAGTNTSEVATSTELRASSAEDDFLTAGYACRESGLVRQCDELDGGNTSCRVNRVKVADHETIQYAPGWDAVATNDGVMPKPNMLRRLAQFVGFGPDRKDVPDEFEVRQHSADTYHIRPGETMYFKMELAFPAFSEGEYWIEAVGDSEYGLLDPFWSSDWSYRMPITIDNTNGTTDLTEYQVFLELDNSLTDFWTNVQSDGSDIRFAQQLSVNNFSNAGTAKNNWFDTSFGGRVPVTIPPLTVTSDQQNFPVYVDLSLFDAGFWSAVKTDGGDIRVTTSDGTELPIDVVEIDTTAETGELHFLADTLAANAANTFYVYYDKPSASGYAASDPFGSEAVWSGAGYQAVYHFSDDPTTIGNTLTDETGNGNNLIVTTSAQATTTGQMGTAYDFNGSAGYLSASSWTFDGGDPLVTTGLYKMSSSDNSAIWQWGTGAQPDDIEFRPWYTGADTNGSGLHYFGATGGATYSFARATSSWHAFGTIGTTSASDNNLVYEDGVLVETVAQTVGNPTNTDGNGFSVGRTGTNGWWDGLLDELRIATTTRTEDRVKWETVNLSEPTHFYAVSSSQVPDNAANLNWYSTSWERRAKFTIPQGKVESNLTDFPVYVDLAMFGPDFFAAVQNDGADIRVTTGDGVTELPIELVAIDTGAKTGELYFKTDLYRNAANDFYVYYQNEDAIAYARTNTYGSNNVWTNGYLAVYHLEEDMAGVSNLNVYQDSTANQYHGDDYNTSNDKTGLFGKGQEFGDDQNDYLSLPNTVLDGVGDLTTSWWMSTVNGGAQGIVSGAMDNTGAGANEYIVWFNSSTNFQIYYQNAAESFGLSDTITNIDTGNWNYFVSTAEDAIDEVNFYVNGVGDTENPDPQPIAPLTIANGGLVVGQEQDALGGGFQTTQNFEGQLDELRFADVVRDADWVATEYANMGDVTTFIATTTAEELNITDFVELDFWLQHFDSTADEADIWLQVADLPAGEETVIYMYYGATGASSASDELATFSYSTSTDLYYVVDNSGATSISVQSLIDNNQVSIDGGAPVILHQGERTTFGTFTAASVISALGPISGTVTGSGNDGGDTIVPVSFASTTMVVPTNRANESWYLYSPFASTTVRSYIANSGTANQTINIATSSAATITTNPGTNQGVVFESTSPVLLTQRSNTPGDGVVAYPPTLRDLYGVYSNTIYISTVTDNPNPLVTCSGGGSGTVSGITRGEAQSETVCSNGSEGAGNAVRYRSQTYPIVAIQQADSDGNESTVFWPQHEFGTRYYMTNDSAYAAIVCSPRFGDVNLEVHDTVGGLVESATCSPAGNNPGKAYFTNGTGNGDSINFTAGHEIISTNGKPFYVIYEDVAVDQDEKNILGSVQGRKFDGAADRAITFGAEEPATTITYDDNHEQLSYAWYENTTSQTPTVRWPIGPTEDAEEGVAISGSGAVDEGDVLRLRLNLAVSSATTTAQSSAFSLQYAAAAGVGQCSAAAGWTDIGGVGSTTALFSGHDNAVLEDGTTLASTTLSQTTVAGTYEERNYSDFNPYEIGVGEVAEWDWALEVGAVDINTTYCFRMIRATGEELTTYTAYPELITVGPPNVPTNLTYFDNEHTTDLTPVLEFVAVDLAGDDIQYQVQVDDDPAFASIDIDRNSTDHFLNFENVTNPPDKAPFTSGDLIRFTSPTGLASSTTYWWRVRASDPDGSATTSDWSTPTSFTTNQNLETSEWFQTTGAQFDTNSLSSLTTAAGSVSVSGILGTMVGTSVDFDDAVVGNAWAEVDWNDTETSGEIRVQVEYKNGGSWQLIPDSLIPSNSTGISTAPINLRELDTDTYNELRLVATFDGSTLSLQDWTIRWGLRVETPVLGDLFDNQKTVDTLPIFDFISSDPQGDDLEYEISFSTDKTFVTGSSTYNSGSDAGFANLSNGGDTTPFTSGDTVTYTTQPGSPFTNGVTYWWRARAKDPNGDDSWSPWSQPDSFTVDTGLSVSTWFQTTRGQFEEGELTGTIATTSGSVVVNDLVGEYGKTTVTNGTWTTVNLQSEYNTPVVVASGRYTPLGDTQRSIRVRNKTTTSFEVLADNFDSSVGGTTVVDYLVMEAGVWNIDDGGTGTQVIAGTYEDVSDVQANTYAAAGYGADVTFSPAFSSPPAVIATVSSDNDSTWVTAHLNDGNTRNNPPTASAMGLYLGRGFESAVHDPEDIDYIAFETGHGVNNGAEFDADFSTDNHDEPPVSAEAFTSAFSSAPQVVIVMQAAEQGGNGGYAGLYAATPPTTSNYYPFIDEDGTGADRNHTTEPVLTLAFEDVSGVLKRYAGPGLSGTIAGENIIFSDGAGPKYDNFSWNDSTPGGSDILYQIEYEVSPGVYALVPNTAIPGNSAGTSTSPIDLTSVDINTYPVIRPFATLTCSGGTCPQINDWQLEWSEGVNMSGTLKEYDRLTGVATGTIRVAVDGSIIPSTGTVSGGIWSVANVTAFAGEIVTVWVDGATESEEAVAAFVYDGTGDITGVELFEQHLSISADEEAVVTNALLGQNDNLALGDEDIFYNVDGSNNLVVCSAGSCSDANIYVGPGNTYTPASAGGVSVSTHDVINDGFLELDTNTINVSGSWTNNATTSVDTSTINLTAATGTESVYSGENPMQFYNLSFGSGAGEALFTLAAGLDLAGSLTVASGTLDRSDYAISIAGNLTTGTGGFWQGTGTTTFDGAGAKTWRDDNLLTQKVGDVLIDGASTNVTALTNVAAYDITIGANDRLNGTSGKVIYVAGDWINNGTFTAQSSRVEIIEDDRTYPPAVPGSQNWYSDSAFDKRIMIAVNPAEVSADLVNFPLYVDLSTLGTNFWSAVASNGRDIRVTSGDGQTELPHDLVSINTTAKTGELHFLADAVDSATTTYFFVYFDNPAASAYYPTDTYGSQAVWAEYEAVYHFSDSSVAVDSYALDATANERHLLIEGAALATSTGRLGQGINLIGSTGILRNAGFTWTAGNPLVTSGWYKMPASSNESLWQWGTGASPDNLEFRPWYNTTGGLHYFGVTSGATYTLTPRDTVNWLHFTTVGATTTGQDNLVYQNAIEVERVTQTVANPYNDAATGLQVGRNGTGGSLQAQIDEFRITTSPRSAGWVQAEYSNQKTPKIFYATTSVQTYTPDLVLDEATHNIKMGGSTFYDLTIDDATTSAAFIDTAVTVSRNFVVVNGDVTLPTTRLTVGGSFTNTGYFQHNNAEVRFTSNSPASITLNGTEFYNSFYNVTFSGNGTFTFLDTNATTTNDMSITKGTVVFPSGKLTIGGHLSVTGTGIFNANNGTVEFISEDNESITTRGSSFNNVVFGVNEGGDGWYSADWSERAAIRVASTSVAGYIANFPVYVDLSMLGASFWGGVATDGRDIRVTSADGKTELPVEIAEISYGAQTGELHFLAPALSPISDTTFYIYFDNTDATEPDAASQYGSEAVWAEYEAVYHFNGDPVEGVADVSGNGRDLAPTVGTPSTTAGVLGTALDTTSSNVMLEDADWTWTAGEDLVSSGLYFMTGFDTGALWEFGSSCATDDCLAFMPWYDNATRGYHRFGETSGNDYNFTRDNSKWHHFTTNGRATNGEAVRIFEDGILRGSYLQTGTGENPSQTGLQIGRYVTNTYMDIDIDELRFATTTRSQQWIVTEYNNLTDVDTFYSTSTESYLDVVSSFTLNEALTDVHGDVTIYYADLVAPTNNFTIGGSALNVGGSYNPNNATTTFDSTDAGETVAFGDGAFYNLSFNGAGGGWTIATTTVLNNASLVTGADFTLAPNTTMSVAGTFQNSFNSAATTWTGSTLVLTGGDYTVTDRLDSGDTYAKLVVSGDSDLVMWNSSASTSTVLDTSSLYMPAFAGTPGLLRIYGAYERTAGTEHWSYDTDFDGTDLTGGGERPATVEIGRGSSIYLATSTTLSVQGAAGATTTVSAISGIYSLNVNAGTADIAYASFQNVGPKGLYLTNGTVLSSLTATEFSIAGGRSGITVDAATVNAQPSTEYTNVTFGTSSANSVYEPAWTDQVVITLQSSVIPGDLSNYPVYVDLSTLGSSFWSGVQSDGRDIRVTTDNGTKLPIDLVEIDASAQTGELHFLASSISSNNDTSFYIHFGNPAATAYAADDTYGANAVWTDYEAVYHFNEDPTVQITDMTGNGRNLYATVGTPATTTGLIGTALDTTASNVRLENVGWTWQAGDDLVSSGLYFMSGNDTGALWQFGTGNGADNGTYLSFMPWYNTATRGYNRFGVTSGSDYDFARNSTIWHHFTTNGRATAGESIDIYEDNLLQDSVTQLGSSENPTNTGLRIGAYQSTTYMDIDVDELRFSTDPRSIDWIDVEYRNFTDPTSLYATSTALTDSFNVSVIGVPTTFWLFSAGTGNRYGEAFDNDDGDPGSIQWDDSNFSITISGVVYNDDGTTPATAPLCNASTEVVTVVLDGVDTYTAACDPRDGSFEVTGIVYTGEPEIVTYISSSAATPQTNVAIYDETTGTGTVSGGVMTVARPNVIDGSVLVLIAGKDDDPTIMAAGGWTQIDVLGNTTGDQIDTGAWYRVVADAGTEAATYDFPADNGEGYSYWMGTLINVDTSTPIDVASTWSKLQNQYDPAAPSITTVTDGALVLGAWYTYRDTEMITPVYGWSDRGKNIVGPETNNLSVSSKSMLTQGATGAATTSGIISSRETHVAQFAFRPASAPTATSSIVAAAVTKTPLGNTGLPYDTITLRDQTSAYGTAAAAANIVVTRPEIENGDVMVLIVGKEDDFNITPPAGWVLGDERIEATGNDMYTAIWYRVVGNAGAEPSTYDFVNNDTTTEEYSYWIGSFSGVDTNNVFDVTPAWSNLQNDSSPAAPAVTTASDGAYVLATWYVIDDGAMDMPGSPWITLAQDVVTNNRLLAVAGRYMATNGNTGAAVMTGGSTDDVNVGQFALRPAALSVADTVADMDLYQNRVIVRHEDISPLSIADMAIFDNDDAFDLPFTATIGATDLLTVLPGSGLFVWSNRTFAPAGEVILAGSGATAADGSLTIGAGATLQANAADGVTIGGSLHLASGAVFQGATSLIDFTATNGGQTITSAASSTITLHDVSFTGVGGAWAVQTPLVSETDILVSTGTVSGVANITVNDGSFYGDGTVSLTGGTALLKKTNTLGGARAWTFNNLTLGSGGVAGVTTPASSATTTVRGVLTIASAHFLDALGSTFDLQGSGNVLVESGTLLEGTSTFRYSGLTPNILRTPYYNLKIDTDSGLSVTANAPTVGLQILGNLTVGASGTSTLNVNTNDPALAVTNNVYIGTKGTVLGSNSALFSVAGSWDNDGVFTANGGSVEFVKTGGSATIAAGNSSFGTVSIAGTASYTMSESATTTGNLTLSTGSFTLAGGSTLAVGGIFSSQMSDAATTWAGTTLSLYGGQSYNINAKNRSETFDTVVVSGSTHPRVWNATSSAVVTTSGSSLYSRNHLGVIGDLYIFGDYVNSSFADYWSYAEDFDGAVLGSPRTANVLVEDNGSVLYTGGSLTVEGDASASTTIASQTGGTYDFTIGGSTDVLLDHYVVRDTTSAGLVFTGVPSVTDISNGDFEVAIADGTAMTVGGTVISANQAMNFTGIRFATTTAINAYNVTATGTSASAWRFVNVIGNLDGEAKDIDPAGDPGYVVWEDSAAIINISGTVYSDEGATPMGITVCDGITKSIELSIAGLTFASTTCGIGTGAYTFTGISYGLSDTLTVYINGEAEKAVTVTQDPVSSISGLDLYQNRVIVRHQSGAPLTIADMAAWDSDDDPDVLFDAETTGTDTLVLPADTKLIVWTGRTFAPNGDVTVSGGGAGASFDGTLELQTGATFTAANGETHTIGGSLIAGAGALFTPAQSSIVFTTDDAGRTIDTNNAGFYNLSLTGSGDWTVTDTTLTVANDYLQNAGAVTLPTATTTIGGAMTVSGGTFDANGGLLYFTAADAGNNVSFGGSDVATVRFNGAGGSWIMSDTNATATDSFTVSAGTVTLPTGNLVVGSDFVVTGAVNHSNGTVVLTASDAGNLITLSGSSLYSLDLTGTGDYTMTDASAAALGSVIVTNGELIAPSATLSIGGSFDATGGVFTHSSGTVLFNSADTGEFVDPGANDFYNVIFGSAAGGWTLFSATTTRNFALSSANSFTLASGESLTVEGVFSNAVGGTATTWANTQLILNSGTEYEIGAKTVATELYENLQIGANTDVSMWNSSAVAVTVSPTGSLYSQDHAAVNGSLYIYGDYHVATTTEYWSYATDFDGAALGGSPRAATVAISSGSTVHVDGGVLRLLGNAAGTTTVSNQGSGTFDFKVKNGTFNASSYSFRNLSALGLQFTGNASVPSLSYGDFEQAADSTVLISLASTTLNANASLLVTNTRFATGGFVSGANVSLDATTTNSWRFTGATGNLWGEAFDVDGSDDCSSVRWDDSQCLLTEQSAYRWRNDDGGEGAPAGTWFDSSWTDRKRIRVVNDDASSYADVAVKVPVDFEANMQTSFDDLRFTDASGTTTLSYWIETYNTGSDALVWVKVPSLAAAAVTEIYMYYGNGAASSLSDPSNVFTVAEDFEDNNITEYSGDITKFATAGTYAYGGGYGLDASPNQSAKATDGIARTDLTVAQGQIIRYMQYVDTTAGSGDEVCTLFAVQSPVTANQNYAVCLEQFGTDRVSLVKNAENTDSTGTLLSSKNMTLSTGWYEVMIDWQTNNDIDVSVFNSSGALQATTSATDSTYSSGGIGFTFWFQHGGWDSYVSWPRTATQPTVYVGAEQQQGGATWAAPQDTSVGGFNFGETARLRVGINNTGLPIESQQFRLEFAPKLTAPSCEAVSGGSFTAVPVAASCGSSAVCMAASASTTNADPTTDHLVIDAGNFLPGEMVVETSNQSTPFDVDQNRYTELEYAIALTINATSDSYCFRVTDGGSALDSYAIMPELTLAFDPQLGSINLNDGADIVLTPGTTTTIMASTTVTDYNGYGDLFAATTTFYKSTVSAACTPDNNNCYVASGAACSFTNCSGATCTLTCSADFEFHADATDNDGGQFWYAFMEVSDQGGATDFDTSLGVDVLTIRALEVLNSINYGSIGINENTGTYNPTVTIENFGNEAIDVQVAGTSMTDGAASTIPASQQRFATSTFDYDVCTECQTLSELGTNLEVDLSKPTTTTPATTDEIYWGIEVPFGIASNPHNGVNTFTAISD
ncbi:MAG: DUF2341 domain-containing protein [Candidatus Nomurabacteria bacterium]|nr:MAG: DUF2341 domain-containing protein [Candidatus Nomurabacteria bacterium]